MRMYHIVRIRAYCQQEDSVSADKRHAFGTLMRRKEEWSYDRYCETEKTTGVSGIR